MGARKYSDTERALHYACALGRLTLEETNAFLIREGHKEIPKGTWGWIVNGYVPQFEGDRTLLGKAIVGVYTLGDLMAIGVDDSPHEVPKVDRDDDTCSCDHDRSEHNGKSGRCGGEIVTVRNQHGESEDAEPCDCVTFTLAE
ncbi:MAG TPA: hypothetical protein VGP07_08880 [Polyangia bacterium]|jgi:hypothetical protein